MALVCHPLSYWDGNTAIVAGKMAIIIHCGVVERHSQIIGNAIKALSGAEKVNGCPALCLNEDPVGLANFIFAMYNGVANLKNGPSDFETVAAILRLAAKYGANGIRENVLRGMHQAWPSTLAKWDSRETLAARSSNLLELQLPYAHPILVINLAREIDAPELLPSAFYDLSRLYESQITGGYIDQSTSRLHVLSPSDSASARVGKREAAGFLSSFILREMQDRISPATCICSVVDDPILKRACQSVFEVIGLDILNDLRGSEVKNFQNADPLFVIPNIQVKLAGLGTAASITGTPVKACEECRIAFALAATTARVDFWKLLPSWFGVSGWAT